jgi:hypothetical protein
MRRRILLLTATLIWITTGLPSSFAQSPDQTYRTLPHVTNDNSGIGQLLHGLGIGPSQEEQSTAAAADGMRLLAQLMEQNGYDRQRAWITFAQSPEGRRIMGVPGALNLLTDWFNAVMALPSGNGPAPVQHQSRAQQRNQGNAQSANQATGEVAGNLTPPFLGPYRPNAYSPGINSDATGRPFVWRPDNGPADPFVTVRPDVFGPGIGMDQYGRPVHAACPEFQPNC